MFEAIQKFNLNVKLVFMSATFHRIYELFCDYAQRTGFFSPDDIEVINGKNSKNIEIILF